MALFDSLSDEDLTALAAAISIASQEVLSADDLNVLGNFVTAVGTLMLTAAAQRQVLTTAKSAAKEAKEKKASEKELTDLKNKVEELAKKLTGEGAGVQNKNGSP